MYTFVCVVVKDERIMFSGTVKKKGSDDNYLARYDKIIVTRSIFIFFSLLLSSTLQCPGSFHHRKDYEWWCNFFPKKCRSKSNFSPAVNTTNFSSPDEVPGGSESLSRKPNSLRGSKPIFIVYPFAFFCATQFTDFSKEKIKTHNFH